MNRNRIMSELMTIKEELNEYGEYRCDEFYLDDVNYILDKVIDIVEEHYRR